MGSIFGAGGFLGFLGTGLGQAILAIGAAVGLNYLSALLAPKPKAPRPEDVQNNIKSGISPRNCFRGQHKVGGTLAFIESKAGHLYGVLACAHGKAVTIDEYWIDDNQVTLDGSGNVTSAPYNSKAVIQSRNGTSTPAPYSDLTAIFPEWTVDHLGKGITSLFYHQLPVKQEDFNRLFPNGPFTRYRMVAKFGEIYDPNDIAQSVSNPATWNYSDNSSRIAFDYLMGADGMRLPLDLLTKPLAIAGWKQAANDCADPIALKAGGTEQRYRSWASWNLEERPADVLSRMLAACDGRLVQTPDGGLTIDVGKWEEPTVIIDDSMIMGFENFGRGRDILNTANVIRATYTSKDHDYTSTDAQAWEDVADTSVRGEIPSQIDLIMSPSHAQTRRLMKVAAFEANPTWAGIFTCNLRAASAIGKRFIRIVYPAFGIDETFKLRNWQLLVGEGAAVVGVRLDVVSFNAQAYNWDAALEEGTAPLSDETTVDRTVPVPAGFAVSIIIDTVNGIRVPRARMTWTATPEGLRVEAQFKETSGSSWLSIGVPDGAALILSPILADGVQYDFRIRHVTQKNTPSAWTSVITLTAIADTVAPGIVTNVTKTGGVGQVTINWKAPNSQNYVAANIRRNTVNTEPSGTPLITNYGAPNFNDSWVDTGMAPGTYFYWLRSVNGSGVESASVATGSVVVT
ncbi:MAG: hypothetical protein ACRCZI_15285 [Cetobacterium sp.]